MWPASGKKSPAEALDAMRKGGPVRARQIRKAQTCAEPTMESHTKLTNISANKSFDKSTNHQSTKKYQEIPRNSLKPGAMARRDAITTGDLPVCWPRGGLGMLWSRFSFHLEMSKSID